MGLEIRFVDVGHEYGRAEGATGVTALTDVTLEIPAGSFAVLMGPSGSGKSTLLNLIGAVDQPSRGRIFLGDSEVTSLSESELTRFRRTSLGFIFQFFNLIPTLTVAENVGFPLALAGIDRSTLRQKVNEVLQRVGLEHRGGHYPNQLSGGEMQRVAIGRAVIHRPPLILADEPTGNLDSRNGQSILDLIAEVHRSYAPTIVMATHSDKAAGFGDRLFHVIDGIVTAAGT